MSNKEVDIILNEIDNFMDEFADKVFARSQEILIDDGKVDTGAMIQTANINKEYLYKQVVYPAEYADVVNYGRQAGQPAPPFEPIYKWVQRKLGIGNEKEARNTAWAIRWSIHERGIQPTFYAERAIEETQNEYQ
jgi:hypothetical protein